MLYFVYILQRMKQNAAELPLTIVYQPVSAGKLKLWTHFELAFKQLGGYGVLVVQRC